MMRIQVYAVVFHKNHFLLATKNDKGYFFHQWGAGGGEIVPAGQDLNGGGNYALPGGRLDVGVGENAKDGALKEFYEETNVDLRLYALGWTVKMFQSTPALYYCGVYFDVGDQLETVAQLAAGNLTAGYNAAQGVIAGTYGVGQYQALRAAFPGCPMDNELGTLQLWDIKSDWDTIKTWQSSPTLGWYYDILKFYRDSL